MIDDLRDLPQFHAEAACAGEPTELWFPEDGHNASREALAICARCPAQEECLDYALRKPERFGVWGGMSSRQRSTLRRSLGWSLHREADL